MKIVFLFLSTTFNGALSAWESALSFWANAVHEASERAINAAADRIAVQ